MYKMSLTQAIKMMLVERKVSLKNLSKQAGVRPQSVSNSLARNTMTLYRLEELLDVLDYEIVLQPKRRGSYPVGSYPITVLNIADDPTSDSPSTFVDTKSQKGM